MSIDLLDILKSLSADPVVFFGLRGLGELVDASDFWVSRDDEEEEEDDDDDDDDDEIPGEVG